MRTPGTCKKTSITNTYHDFQLGKYANQPLLQIEIFVHFLRLLLQGNVRKEGCTNLLGDSTRFTVLDIRSPDLVKELGLSRIDMPEKKKKLREKKKKLRAKGKSDFYRLSL